MSSEADTAFMYQPTPQTASYNTDILPEAGDELSFRSDAHTMMWNSGLELDLNLEYDLYEIEGLVSNEGLDWFTGAVLQFPCADDQSVAAREGSKVPATNLIKVDLKYILSKDDAHWRESIDLKILFPLV